MLGSGTSISARMIAIPSWETATLLHIFRTEMGLLELKSFVSYRILFERKLTKPLQFFQILPKRL